MQRAAYKAFAHNNVILFDTTHISSSTDYKLATVMAVSNTHKGVPCMYAVISSETKRLLKVPSASLVSASAPVILTTCAFCCRLCFLS